MRHTVTSATETAVIRDDFAGAGGWEEGLRLLGIGSTGVVGVENNEPANATAEAAGHVRLHCTVQECRPMLWPALQLYIGSPPCQTFSQAGKGSGRDHMAALLHAVRLVAAGATPEDAVAAASDAALDERSVLVLEPLYVIRQHRPTFVALEQVPGVLPLWVAYAAVLKSWGYSVATGCVTAEQYGVPQTRKRAVLLARCDGRVAALPEPTHSRYNSRDPSSLELGLLPWVSMAEALGHGMTARPGMTVAVGTDTGGADASCVGGSGARATLHRELDAGRWRQRSNYNDGATADRTRRAGAEPSVVITGRPPQWETAPGALASGTRANAPVRPLTEPATTLAFGHDAASYVFVPEGTAPTDVAAVKRGDDPEPWAPTFNDQSGTLFDPAWPEQRPATVVAGREIVQNPGATANRFNGSTKSRNDGVRVSVAEAAVLQTFPADYPWRGTKTQQYQQVGNAVPPVLAAALLAALLDPTAPEPEPDLLSLLDEGPVEYVNGTHDHAARRSIDAPAPTVMFGARANRVTWERQQTMPPG